MKKLSFLQKSCACLVILLSACGHKTSHRQATPLPPNEPSLPTEAPPALQLLPSQGSSFYGVGADAEFTIHSPIKNSADDIAVYRNRDLIPTEQIKFAAGVVKISNFFVEGENKIAALSTNMNGETEIYDQSVWAGSNNLKIHAVDVAGSPIKDAHIKVNLGDDVSVSASCFTAEDGSCSVANIPSRTVNVTGVKGSSIGVLALAGDAEQGSVILKAISKPSDVDNNHFKQGITGWVISKPEAVKWTKHEESAAAYDIQPLLDVSANTTENMDLVLSTLDEGAQTATRSFTPKKSGGTVKVRFKFVTSEVPGGFFGSRYNDYFSVTIRDTSGHVASKGSSMNALGRAAFDSQGATDWMELNLSQQSDKDTVEVEAVVANVADGAYQSQIIIDFVDEQSLEIVQASIFDIDSRSLLFLSADAHPYFGGKTKVLNTIQIRGGKEDRLKNLDLEVMLGAKVVAKAEVQSDMASKVLKSLSEEVKITNPTFLFALSGTDFATLGSTATKLRLRLSAKSEKGETAVYELGQVGRLMRYQGSRRYGQRDVELGGDDWAHPHVIKYVDELAGSTFNDFSNMNGGVFAPHSSHRDGLDVDGFFDGYQLLNDKVAEHLVQYLNGSVGAEIQFVFAKFERSEQNSFWQKIKDARLLDGREVKQVIRADAGHGGHYHVRFFSSEE